MRGTAGVHWGDDYPSATDKAYPVLVFASRQGDFCCYDNFLLLGQGRRLMPIYSATRLTLATVAEFEPVEVPLRVTVEGEALVCWPEEFPGYELYWSTNLSQTNWTLIPGMRNFWLESLPASRTKFFHLRQP